ncbi:pentapeptide repeat-containing protein [Streptomyces griseoflavus]|uniref:pentapeptide repeat-containing protein n=1 Tax=Streptomyces griseoflavus TaxID=35619 RepID=UPI0033A11A74
MSGPGSAGAPPGNEARLIGTKLVEADLYRSPAEGAGFSGADLTRASLVRAHLDDAAEGVGATRQVVDRPARLPHSALALRRLAAHLRAGVPGAEA